MKQGIPILTLTLTLSGTVTAQRFVKASGAQTGAGENAIGVARTSGVSGGKIAVDAIGTCMVEAGAAVSAGDTLKADASGKAITWATSGAKIGTALEAAGADGEIIEVLLMPNVA